MVTVYDQQQRPISLSLVLFGKERTVFLTSGGEKLRYSIFCLVLYSARIMLEVKSIQFTLNQVKRVKLQHYFSFSYFVSFYSARIMLGVRVYSFPFIRVGKLSYSILILRFQTKMLWYVFYFKFPPLKTFTRKTLQLSSEGIIVKRGNSYEEIVPSRCLSSLDSKILVIVWQPGWMGFNQMFKKTVYAFVWSPAVRTCWEPSALSPPVNYFDMRPQRKYFDVT